MIGTDWHFQTPQWDRGSYQSRTKTKTRSESVQHGDYKTIAHPRPLNAEGGITMPTSALTIDRVEQRESVVGQNLPGNRNPTAALKNAIYLASAVGACENKLATLESK